MNTRQTLSSLLRCSLSLPKRPVSNSGLLICSRNKPHDFPIEQTPLWADQLSEADQQHNLAHPSSHTVLCCTVVTPLIPLSPHTKNRSIRCLRFPDDSNINCLPLRAWNALTAVCVTLIFALQALYAAKPLSSC